MPAKICKLFSVAYVQGSMRHFTNKETYDFGHRVLALLRMYTYTPWQQQQYQTSQASLYIYIVHSNTYLSSEAAAASAAVHCAGGCITQSHRRRCSFQLKQPSVRPFFLPPFPPPTLTTAFVVSRSNVNAVCSNLSLSFPTTHNSTLHSGSNVPLPKFCN